MLVGDPSGEHILLPHGPCSWKSLGSAGLPLLAPTGDLGPSSAPHSCLVSPGEEGATYKKSIDDHHSLLLPGIWEWGWGMGSK